MSRSLSVIVSETGLRIDEIDEKAGLRKFDAPRRIDRFGWRNGCAFRMDLLKSAKRFSKTIFMERIRRTGCAAFARAQTTGKMRTKQMRRADAAGTRQKVHEIPYVNPLYLIGACRAASTHPGRKQRRVHFFTPKRVEKTRVAPPLGGGRRARAPQMRSACTSLRPRRPRLPRTT